MKQSRRFDILIWVLALVPLAAAVLIYPRLPQTIPTHWGFDGTADGYGPRESIFFTAALPVALQLLMAALPHLDPRGKSYSRFARPYRAMRVVLALFCIGLTGMQAAAAWPGAQVNTAGFLTAGMGLVLAAFGNYMPKIRPNFMCGIRTPWTLASENVWRKTHRRAVLGGGRHRDGAGRAVCARRGARRCDGRVLRGAGRAGRGVVFLFPRRTAGGKMTRISQSSRCILISRPACAIL